MTSRGGRLESSLSAPRMHVYLSLSLRLAIIVICGGVRCFFAFSLRERSWLVELCARVPFGWRTC
jgi:hypothetical protein